MMPLSRGKRVMLGNEAIAYGAVEAGLEVAAGYPGTPSTEIIETLMKIKSGAYIEWSINEKVAYETAYGSAMMGAKAMATMKHVGVNVAADPLFSSSYSGINGSLVIVSADDPSMWSSQNEQDNRYYGMHALIPVIEPYDPQSAHDLVIEAFKISEKFGHPVMLRTTTRIGHVRSQVSYLASRTVISHKVIKEPNRFVMAPETAKNDRIKQIERWEKIKHELEYLNSLEGDENSEELVIASGISYAYVKDVVAENGIKCRILKLSTPFPVPEKMLVGAMKKCKSILVVEENDPVVEMQVKSIMVDNSILREIHGKDYISQIGEMSIEKVRQAFSKFFHKEMKEMKSISKEEAVMRPPAMCPGCPHRASFFGLKKGLAMVSMQNSFYSGDIGCYTLGMLPPYNVQDSATNMGSSIGIANGIYRATETVPVAIIGDSTFFHSGLEGVANAVYHDLPVLIIVLDNRSTAMTGQQPSPSVDIDIEGVAKAMGVQYTKTYDPFSIKESYDIVKNAAQWIKDNSKPALLVSKRSCALEVLPKVKGDLPVAIVDENKCTGCTICYDYFTCPSILPLDNKKAFIDDTCIGCGACVEVCPFKAISIKGEKPEGWDAAWLD
ncbi:MAG: indolepyruvate ferredoxin oxidoreductase subunit alpha [Thermoplasmata archaeon]